MMDKTRIDLLRPLVQLSDGYGTAACVAILRNGSSERYFRFPQSVFVHVYIPAGLTLVLGVAFGSIGVWLLSEGELTKAGAFIGLTFLVSVVFVAIVSQLLP